MESWQLAEEEWRSLVLRYGPPVETRELSAGQVDVAIAESRVLAVDVRRDGIGGGEVRFELAQSDRAGQEYLHYWFCVVFPGPCRLTGDTVQRLNLSAWEDWSRVHWVTATAQLVSVLSQAADFAKSHGGSNDPQAALAARIRALTDRVPGERTLLDELNAIFAPHAVWDREVGAGGRPLANRVLALFKEVSDRTKAAAREISPSPAEPKPVVGHARKRPARTAAEDLIDVLKRARSFLALPDNDFMWSSWESASDALREVDALITAIASGALPPRLDIAVLFSPTGPIQEVSLSSGWGEAFVDLARQCDAALTRAYA
jgi:hypothetical protein